VDCVVERLWILGNIDVSKYSPEELVLIGACDPVRLFVKQEPHKIAKIQTKRFRLISSVSLIDQLVERVLFGVQNRVEISMWEMIPSKPGIGLTDEMAKKVFLNTRMASSLGPLAEADISGWDWSVQAWELEADVEIRIQLCKGLHSCASNAMRARMFCLANSVFSFSDGHMIAQVYPGLMKSGSYLTSSSNSRMRVFDHYVLATQSPTWVQAMGDDSVEVDISRPGKSGAELYESLGKTVGMYNLCPRDASDRVESFEFCSQRFGIGCAVPLNWPKMLAKFVSNKDISLEIHDALMTELRHLPRGLLRKIRDYTLGLVVEQGQNKDV